MSCTYYTCFITLTFITQEQGTYTPKLESAGWTSITGLNNTGVCCCDAQSAESHVSSDAELIKLKYLLPAFYETWSFITPPIKAWVWVTILSQMNPVHTLTPYVFNPLKPNVNCMYHLL
jgi:hypothetical protein